MSHLGAVAATSRFAAAQSFILRAMRFHYWAIVAAVLGSATAASAQPPSVPNIVESPNVKVLTGYTVQEFEQEMQLMTSYLGVNCGYCHEGRRNFASEAKPQKLTARKMLEMTRNINQQEIVRRKGVVPVAFLIPQCLGET